MNEQKLKKLIELVTFDQSFIDLAHKVQTAQTTSKNIQIQLDQLEEQLKKYTFKQHEAVKYLHDQELKLQEFQDQETHLIALSQSVATPKEYEAANKEIDRLKLNRHQQEQKMMQWSNKAQTAEKELQVFLLEYQMNKDQFVQLIAQEIEAVKELQNQLLNLEQSRKDKIGEIPLEWINTYETMRGRVSNPVVPVYQDSCSACFYFMSSRDAQVLRDQGLLQCKDCFRFLYFQQS